MSQSKIVKHRLEGFGKGPGDRNPDAHKNWPKFLTHPAEKDPAFYKVGDKRWRKKYPRV